MNILNLIQPLKTWAVGLLYFLIVVNSINALADQGTAGGGGGDLCESRIKEIRNDLRSWIRKDGAMVFNYKAGLTHQSYKKKMLPILADGAVSIECLKKGDPRLPLKVFGATKDCVFTRSSAKPEILCDYEAFLNMKKTSEEKQYEIVHHEYAGVAGVEIPKKNDSDYHYSVQLPAFLADYLVKRLSVKVEGCTSGDCVEICHTDGCVDRKNAQFKAVFDFLSAEDECMSGVSWLQSLRRAGDYMFQAVCGDRSDKFIRNLKVTPKNEGIEDGEYNVEIIENTKDIPSNREE